MPIIHLKADWKKSVSLLSFVLLDKLPTIPTTKTTVTIGNNMFEKMFETVLLSTKTIG